MKLLQRACTVRPTLRAEVTGVSMYQASMSFFIQLVQWHTKKWFANYRAAPEKGRDSRHIYSEYSGSMLMWPLTMKALSLPRSTIRRHLIQNSDFSLPKTESYCVV